MIVKVKTTKSKFLEDFLTVINGIVGLSKMEIKVLSEFIKIKYTLPDGFTLFSPDSRRIVRNSLAISEANLNNYISALKIKGALTENSINPTLVPEKDTRSITFNFEIA